VITVLDVDVDVDVDADWTWTRPGGRWPPASWPVRNRTAGGSCGSGQRPGLGRSTAWTARRSPWHPTGPAADPARPRPRCCPPGATPARLHRRGRRGRALHGAAPLRQRPHPITLPTGSPPHSATGPTRRHPSRIRTCLTCTD